MVRALGAQMRNFHFIATGFTSPTDYIFIRYPVGLGTKNHCAGEGQQQFSSQSTMVYRATIRFKGNVVETKRTSI
jgi:hypothetical protein